MSKSCQLTCSGIICDSTRCRVESFCRNKAFINATARRLRKSRRRPMLMRSTACNTPRASTPSFCIAMLTIRTKVVCFWVCESRAIHTERKSAPKEPSTMFSVMLIPIVGRLRSSLHCRLSVSSDGSRRCLTNHPHSLRLAFRCFRDFRVKDRFRFLRHPCRQRQQSPQYIRHRPREQDAVE
jgi:hypothetical protein